MIRRLGPLVRFRSWRWCGGELAGTGKIVATTTAGEQAVVTDAVEPARQNVKQEPADELVGGERHDLVALGALAAMILVAERHPRSLSASSRRLEMATRWV